MNKRRSLVELQNSLVFRGQTRARDGSGYAEAARRRPAVAAGRPVGSHARHVCRARAGRLRI